MTPRLLTEAEAAALLRCRPSRVGKLRRRGALPYYDVRPFLFSEADVFAYMDSRKRRPSSDKNNKTDADIAAQARQLALRQRLARKTP